MFKGTTHYLYSWEKQQNCTESIQIISVPSSNIMLSKLDLNMRARILRGKNATNVIYLQGGRYK